MPKLPKSYKISYAQNREDRIIEAFFPDVHKGLYIDIGANDPQDDSVTKLFYDKGWRGINIEPNPELIKKLSRARREDINLAVGVSNKAGKISFREYDNHGLSTFSEDSKKENAGSKNAGVVRYKDYEVTVVPLSEILKEHVGKKLINFMKVDVEGYEFEVLEGNDWSLYRPELLCIEANHIKHDWRKLLRTAQYELAFNDGLNEYYLRKESTYRLQHFDYANAMILSGIIVNPGLARRITEFQRVSSENEELRKKVASTENARKKLASEIEHYQSLRYSLRQLIKNILKRFKIY